MGACSLKGDFYNKIMNSQRHGRPVFYPVLGLVAGLLLSSCTAVTPMPTVRRTTYPRPATRRDIVHTIAPGETLWRISKMYSVPIAMIMCTNRLASRTDIKYGQKLLIPEAAPIEPVISLFPNDKWKYIIIHHSATEGGSSLQFHEYHLKKGWDHGVGYHFVIDKGASNKQDGQIETTPRWLKQQDGAHCKADDMNTRAIGICLVGNFNHEKVSAAQMRSLVMLVNKLKHYYQIPRSHILGHRDVKGSCTECPGRHFPWERFLRQID